MEAPSNELLVWEMSGVRVIQVKISVIQVHAKFKTLPGKFEVSQVQDNGR